MPTDTKIVTPIHDKKTEPVIKSSAIPIMVGAKMRAKLLSIRRTPTMSPTAPQTTGRVAAKRRWVMKL